MAIDPLGDIDCFLVPVDGSDAAYGALAMACDVARRRKAKVVALHVIEVPRSLPLEADLAPEAERGEEILTRAERIADEHDIQLVGALVQARDAGQALVDEAVDAEADAIVVGLDHPDLPYERFEIGRLPQYAIENAACEVWLIRYRGQEAGDSDEPVVPE